MISPKTVVLWLMLFCLAQSAAAATVDEIFKEYGVRVDKPTTFTVVKDQRMSGEVKSQHLIELETTGREKLSIKIIRPIEATAAQALVEAEQNTLKKVYAASQTPYMGDIAQAIGGCPPSFGPMRAPMTVMKIKVDALLGAAKADFAFGACDQATAKHKGALISYYDPASKSVWTWRVFSPWSDPKTKLSSNWLAGLMGHFQQ